MGNAPCNWGGSPCTLQVAKGGNKVYRFRHYLIGNFQQMIKVVIHGDLLDLRNSVGVVNDLQRPRLRCLPTTYVVDSLFADHRCRAASCAEPALSFGDLFFGSFVEWLQTAQRLLRLDKRSKA